LDKGDMPKYVGFRVARGSVNNVWWKCEAYW